MRTVYGRSHVISLLLMGPRRESCIPFLTLTGCYKTKHTSTGSLTKDRTDLVSRLPLLPYQTYPPTFLDFRYYPWYRTHSTSPCVWMSLDTRSLVSVFLLSCRFWGSPSTSVWVLLILFDFPSTHILLWFWLRIRVRVPSTVGVLFKLSCGSEIPRD